ncbi:MAG: colanic acid biosynthesis glycosyl transferase [Mesorhizobium sp.]|nr:colanic acid biosynthesis glycosyl transferase [Mesorhizobium sp. M4B.F.Ca.ET.058.02.1.1]RVC44604.1 colanic acid biosynthesis glycosyl transferase [Mesorhizobium sp. M4A.F.Ca.ET.090.04.2.1]RWC57441.1 MAG: colanic acid biosynthesis glycosyl transferase [Mesorhizobium sp.]RWD05435.1 MAG: colanic acid biosynthesis glycosyl transferase [Mesorhizobium sp.]RWD14937.1 MAG: colanic acid biosynthesis glycosyl transferase [Mesorhizobium sp.]
MNIVVENTVCLNTGDAAILLAIRHILKAVVGDEPRFFVFDSQPEVAAKLYPKKDYPDLEFHKLLSETMFRYSYGNGVKHRLKPLYNRLVLQVLQRFGSEGFISRILFGERARRSLDIYRSADLVVTTGGTYLVENYNLERRLNQFRVDAILGKDPVFFTQSLGPFNKSYNRQELTPILDRSPLILLRDERSRNHILDMVKEPGKCHVVADAVFALADTDRIGKRLASAQPPVETGRVAISVRHWNYVNDGEDGMRRYLDSVREIATILVRDHAKEVTFVSTCQGVPEYAHDDSKTARAIVAELDPEIAKYVSVDASFHTPDQLMALVKGFDFVVATRMHMMIMSLCVGTPVLPIAYEFKTKEVAKRVGVADLLLDIDTVTPQEAAEKLGRFAGNLDQYRRTSLQAVLEEHASAMSATDLLKPLVPGASADVARDVGKGGGKHAARLGKDQHQDEGKPVVEAKRQGHGEKV